MWMRTTLYYQHRYGASTLGAVRELYAQGGVARFYRGLGAALLQGPLSRFGDVAASAGTIAAVTALSQNTDVPLAATTVVSAACAASWRIALMPLDTAKTMLQVEGQWGPLRAKLRAGGPTVLFHGAAGLGASAFLGHYSWFFVCSISIDQRPGPCVVPSRGVDLSGRDRSISSKGTARSTRGSRCPSARRGRSRATRRSASPRRPSRTR
mmetsp:Transcript_7606/g.31482  ORF Transcript_7606/g.31482 Transcript_7606/m.31482 type:complete len:210 (-) Transcript_7606:370-999(-)